MTVAEGLRSSVRRTPHRALRGLVSDYHGYHADGLPPGVHHGLPSCALTVIVAFEEPVDVAWAHDAASRDRHWVMVSGLHDGPALIHHRGFQHGVQLDLTPLGARVLLGVPAGALARTVLSAPMTGPLAAMYDAMARATTWDQRFDVLDALLLDRVAGYDGAPIRPELRRAWQRVRRSAGAVRVADLAAEVGWSRRHLTERFTAEFGVGPKQAARIERFQRARLLLARPGSVGEVAAVCGYADQAHLDRDFRALGGCTPTQWRAESRLFGSPDPAFVQDGDERR